jgi:hypothetical protein
MYQDFAKGVQSMNELKAVPHPQAPGGFAYHGNLMVSSIQFLQLAISWYLTRIGLGTCDQWFDA